MDSGVLIFKLSKIYDEVYPAYIKAGLKWEYAELYWLNKYLNKLRPRTKNRIKPLTVIPFALKPLYFSHWSITGKGIPASSASWSSVYLPGRNLFLLSLAGLFCANSKIANIAIGTLQGNPFSDATKSFFQKMNEILHLSYGLAIRIYAPLIATKKSSLIKDFSDLPIELTFSCINPKGKIHCGICTKCYERRKFFRKSKVVDKTIYHKN